MFGNVPILTRKAAFASSMSIHDVECRIVCLNRVFETDLEVQDILGKITVLD